MTFGSEDEDRMIKMSPYTDWILRHSAFNGQIEDSELTEENETAAEGRQRGLWVGWTPREEGEVLSVYAPLRWNKTRTENCLSDSATQRVIGL